VIGAPYRDQRPAPKTSRSVLRSAGETRARAAQLARRSAVLLALCALSRDSRAMLTRCAWCDRIQLGSVWMQRDDAPTLPHGIAERTTHGICPDCVVEMRRSGQSR
jgi:hypothetical protein